MTSHVLRDQRKVAVEEAGYRRNTIASMQLTNLIHLPSVEGIVHTLAIRVELNISVRILASSEAGIAKQLLDCIIEEAVEKNKALAAVQLLGEFCPLHFTRHILLRSMLGHCSHISISNISRFELGVRSPFECTISVTLANSAASI